jgi:hypothetical protein
MEWLLVWLIVNALFVVWRALGVSYELETRHRSIRKNAKSCKVAEL